MSLRSLEGWLGSRAVNAIHKDATAGGRSSVASLPCVCVCDEAIQPGFQLVSNGGMNENDLFSKAIFHHIAPAL